MMGYRIRLYKKFIVQVWLMGVFFLLFFFSQAFASNSIQLSASHNDILLWEMFQVQIAIESTGSLQGDVKLQGVENFHVLGNAQQDHISIFNGQQVIKKVLTFTMAPTKEGVFTLGPVSLGSHTWALQSDSLQLTVKNSRVSTNVQQDTNVHSQQNIKEERKENRQNIKSVWNSDEQAIKDEQLIEFHDVSNPRISFSNVILLVSFFLCLLGVWLCVRQHNRRSSQEAFEYGEVQGLGEEINEIYDWREEILEIGKDCLGKECVQFYSSLQIFLRGYFKYMYDIDVWSYSLKEIQQVDDIPSEMKRIFAKIYFIEFSGKDDTDREALITEIITLLEKYDR